MVIRPRRTRALLMAAALLVMAVAAGMRTTGASANTRAFNRPGNVLVSDQFNNRVVEIDPQTHDIVWSFGSGDPRLCNPGPGAIIGLNSAERLSDGLTLLSGTGVPKGSSPVAPDFSCTDNRVIVVDRGGHIVWQYGQAGVTGSGPNQLNVPVFAIQLPNRDIMVVDQGNNRVIEVGRFSHDIVWSYHGALNNPNSAELLSNGHLLIGDENNNRVIEITRAGDIVWQYGSGDPAVTRPISGAAFASRLPDGHTLITDSGHSRIVEVTMDKQVVWQYFTNTVPHSNSAPLPSNAVGLADGDTSIADQFNHRVLIVDHSKSTEFQYGVVNTPGNRTGQLDGPYTAFVVGDYTGQTPPPPEF